METDRTCGKWVGMQECQPKGLSAHYLVHKAYIIHIGGGLAIMSSVSSQQHWERAVPRWGSSSKAGVEGAA